MRCDPNELLVEAKGGLSRLPLLRRPSPLERLPRLSAHLGGPQILVKRDDEGGRGGGGNKLRKFERQFAAALAQGKDTLVLAAHPQSNAARELVGAAAAIGMRTVIVSKRIIPRDSELFRTGGNALLLTLMGADLVEVPDGQEFSAAMRQIERDLTARGRKPYLLPFGASDALGCLGYADCAAEILDQAQAAVGRAPDWVVVPTGSCGTQAGLVAGLAMAGVSTRVLGVSILKSADDAQREVSTLARGALALVGRGMLEPGEVLVDDDFRGDAYGVPTPDGLDAIRLLARLEGLFLCPVYTGKAMAGLLSYVRRGIIGADDVVVFVHTGGLPLLLAYADAFYADMGTAISTKLPSGSRT